MFNKLCQYQAMVRMRKEYININHELNKGLTEKDIEENLKELNQGIDKYRKDLKDAGFNLD